MIRCVVSLGSILSTFLILIIVNDLKSSTNLPDPMMFTDDTNLFYMNKNIEALSEIANNELQHVNDWFRTSRLSLHEGKHFFFHKQRLRYSIPLRIPILKFNNVKVKKEASIKFLG